MRTSTKLFLLLLLAGLAPQALAQAPGSCRVGTAQTFINVNDVQASLFNTGGLFYGGSTTGGDGYLVPKAAGNLSPIFASGVWVGGQVGGDLRIAAARYGSYNFWPGPLDEATGRPVNPNDCAQYDRLYNVSRQDIRNYEAGLAPARDLADWPVDLGAPVVDGDGDPENYNLAGGDRPQIIGDQGIWWVMNDVGNEHAGTNTAPLGIEVQVLAWAFARADALGQTTFYRYTIINKGPNTITDTYISVFSDPDLGDAGDDYVGIDTTLSLGYVYNDSNTDGNYGSPPPAAGYDFFQGPIVDGDTLGATAFSTFINSTPATTTGDPQTGEQYYNYQQGLWGDGSPYTALGVGYQTDGEPTKFIYPGDPATEAYWSEVNNDGSGTDNPPGDRRLVISTGPFTLNRGDSQDIVFGVVFAQGTSNLNSVAALRAADVLAQTAYDVNFELAPPPPPPPRCNPNSPNPQLRPGSGSCLEAVELNNKATLVWGYPTTSENFLARFEVEDALLADQDVDDSTYNFEGFNIYRYPTSDFAVDQRELVATFDVDNGVTTVIDQVSDSDTGGLVPAVVARGTDSGVKYAYDISNLTNNTDYFYGITAYSFNEESTPKVIESSATQITVRPSRLTRGDLTQSAFGDSTSVGIVNQAGEGSVAGVIVDPTQVTGDSYEVRFFTSSNDGGTPEDPTDDVEVTNYSIYNVTQDRIILDGADYFQRTGRALPQEENVVVADGISFSVAGPPGELLAINDISPDGRFHTMVSKSGTLALNSNTNPPRFIFSANGESSAATVLTRTDWQGHVAERAPIDYEFRFVENPAENGQIALNRQWDEVDPAEATLRGYFVADGVSIEADEFVFVNGEVIEHPNGRMPFQVWEVSPDGTERQVAIAMFDDADDRIWNPSLGQLDYGFGSDAVYDRIYVRDTEYDEALIISDPTTAYNDFFAGQATIGRVLYVPYTGHSQMPTPGTIVRYTTSKPNLPGDVFSVNTRNLQIAPNGAETAEQALDRIAVVPNPYMGESSYESGNLSRVVRFTNLPPEAATIQIYTVAGSLVKTLRKEGPSRSLDWNLETENNLPVASGMYLIRVDIAGVGDRILKFGVVNRRTQISVF